MKKSSLKIDLMQIVAQACKALWRERYALLRLSSFPFAAKFITFIVIILLGLQDNLLRQGLYFIPSYFVEGWFVAVSLRLALYQEQWPFFLTGEADQDRRRIEARRRAIKGCGIVYVLVRMLSAALVAGLSSDMTLTEVQHGLDAVDSGALPDVPPAVDDVSLIGSTAGFVLAALLLAATIWAFRYTCLYVPVALGIDMRRFLKAIWGFKSSFQLYFIALFFFLPCAAIFGVLHQALASLFGADVTLSADYFLYSVLFSALQSGFEVFVAVLSALGLGFLVLQFMKGEGKKP